MFGKNQNLMGMQTKLLYVLFEWNKLKQGKQTEWYLCIRKCSLNDLQLKCSVNKKIFLDKKLEKENSQSMIILTFIYDLLTIAMYLYMHKVIWNH